MPQGRSGPRGRQACKQMQMWPGFEKHKNRPMGRESMVWLTHGATLAAGKDDPGVGVFGLALEESVGVCR